MTREEFLDLWNTKEIVCSPRDAMPYVRAEVQYQDDCLLLNFDLFTEEEVYALRGDFFRQLREMLPELDAFAKKIIAEQELNWNDAPLKLSEIRLRKTSDNAYYHAFALTYYGGEIYDDDCYDDDGELIDDSCPDLLLMHVCFDRDFQFAEAFNEQEMID